MISQTLGPEDRYAIRELYAQYAWSRSTADIDVFASLFTSAALISDETVEFKGIDGPRDYIWNWLNKRGAAGQQYWFMQLVLEGDHKQCSARAFVMAPMLNPIGTPSMVINRIGYVQDTLVKEAGQWKFLEHRIEQWRGDVLDGFPSYQAIEKKPLESRVD